MYVPFTSLGNFGYCIKYALLVFTAPAVIDARVEVAPRYVPTVLSLVAVRNRCCHHSVGNAVKN